MRLDLSIVKPKWTRQLIYCSLEHCNSGLNSFHRCRYVVILQKMSVLYNPQFNAQSDYVLVCINPRFRMQLHCRKICDICSTFLVERRTGLHKLQFRSAVTMLYDLR